MCGRSVPSVVSLPWPGYTQAPSGSVPNTRSSRSSMSCPNRFGSCSVLPGPPGNRESPVNRCELSATPHLFTGDSLFPGGPGNTEHDPKRFGQLMDDLEERVFGPLPDGTWVYPGHGKDTTLGTERPHVQEWRARGW